MYSFVASSGIAVLLLYGLGDFDAFRQIPVLHQFEDDVACGSVRVEALLLGLVVALV